MTDKNIPENNNGREIRPNSVPLIEGPKKYIQNLVLDIVQCTKDWIKEINIWNIDVVYCVDQWDITIFWRKLDDLLNDGKKIKALWSEIIENYWKMIVEIISEQEWILDIKKTVKFMGNNEDFYFMSDYHPIINE